MNGYESDSDLSHELIMYAFETDFYKISGKGCSNNRVLA